MTTIRLAFRVLVKTPFVTGIAVLSLALGIGANTAIFSLFNQTLRRPLPVTDPQALVNLSAPGPKPGSTSCNQGGTCDEGFSYMMFRDLEHDPTAFSGLAAHQGTDANVTYRNQTMHTTAMLISGNYFDVLGLSPARGRLIGPSDERAIGDSPVAVLSYDYWRAHTNFSPHIVNDTIVVNGQTLTIVGIAPEGFHGTTLGTMPSVFLPITLRDLMQPSYKVLENRRAYWLYAFGRLKPGIGIDRAAAVLNTRYHAILNDVEAPLQRTMSAATLARFKAKPILLSPGARGQSRIHTEARTPILLLFAVTGVVLLIACANVANLLLARSTARAGEIAIRLSIGAGRARVIGQLLVEACLLAVLGGAAGLGVAKFTLTALATALPADAAASLMFQLDPALLMFAAAVSMGTGVLFGLFPALHSTKPDLASTLKGISGQMSGGRGAAWFRSSLVTTQIMLSMALLGVAGLFIQSLTNVSRVDLGINVDRLVTFGVSPRLNAYSPQRSVVLFARIEQDLRAMPGAAGVVLAVVPILSGDNWGSGVLVQDFQRGPDVDNGSSVNEIGAGYFHTLGIPVISGREFTTSDVLGSPKVAIVNEAFARKFNLGRDAVGKWMSQNTGPDAKLDTEIVGLVKDTKYSDVKVPVPPLHFRPYAQDDGIGGMHFYVETRSDPASLMSSIPGLVARIDSSLPVEDLKTMPQQVRENVFLDRMVSAFTAAFAVLATLLAAIGLYGVLAYVVTQRTREFGLRMALGADRRNVRWLILRQVAWMTTIGGIAGVGLALGIGRFAKALLFGMEGYDPLVLGSAVGLLALVALTAGLVPAIRASRIEPMKALRYE